jgi:hypothetical protein
MDSPVDSPPTLPNCTKTAKSRSEMEKVKLHQGDNMSPVLFPFIMQTFLDTFKIEAQAAEFTYFPENKNAKISTCKIRLLGQNVKAKCKSFNFRCPFYVDDSAFILNSHHNLERTAANLYKHSKRFGLSMHVGNTTKKSKTVAMFFPKMLE